MINMHSQIDRTIENINRNVSNTMNEQTLSIGIAIGVVTRVNKGAWLCDVRIDEESEPYKNVQCIQPPFKLNKEKHISTLKATSTATSSGCDCNSSINVNTTLDGDIKHEHYVYDIKLGQTVIIGFSENSLLEPFIIGRLGKWAGGKFG